MTILTLSLLASSCIGAQETPNLRRIYSQSAKYHGPGRNPVIVIPGVLGSRLVDSESGVVVWGSFARGFADPGKSEGARLIALPMREGAELEELRDDVTPDGVLDRLKLSVLGLPVELKAYFEILSALGAGGYADQTLGEAGAVDYGSDHYTCFQFDYDWRRDNVENARRLHEFILERKAYVREERRKSTGVDDPDIKFDIVAHSMGALLLQYYLRYGDADLPADGSPPKITWAGAKSVERVVVVAPPHAGSIQAFKELIGGTKLGGPLPTYPSAIVGTFPATYQLLPRSRHHAILDGDNTYKPIDIYDPVLWETRGWGLASPAADGLLQKLLPDVTDPADRRRIAVDHQRKSLDRARKFHEAIDSPASPPSGLAFMLIAGDALLTPARVAIHGEGKLEMMDAQPGDGTVLRSSALMDERVGSAWSPELVSPHQWSQVVFLFEDHIGLTKSPAFTDNVLYWLLEAQRVRTASHTEK